MIRDVGNIELCELLETEPKTQCTACLSYWDIGIVSYTCGHSCRKKLWSIENSVNIRWTFFQSQSYLIKKGRACGHRDGKKPGDIEFSLVNQLKKKYRKRQYHGIHDRFLRDHELRIRMMKIIETKFVDDGMFLQMKIILIS